MWPNMAPAEFSSALLDRHMQLCESVTSDAAHQALVERLVEMTG